MNNPSANQDLREMIESAKNLGVEIDEEEALQWLASMASQNQQQETLSVNEEKGIFAHRVVLLDFDANDLARVRKIAAIVEVEDRPGVETAIALSGSAAQSVVQTFPGDFDYFERINILAETRQEANLVLADVLRDKALKSAVGNGYQLIEVRFGSYQNHLVRDGKVVKPGDSVTWSVPEIQDGYFMALDLEGNMVQINWEDVSADPGWCKIDWVIVDPARPRAIKASNMFDVTWENPAGNIVALDGFIDPHYQEVYLDASSMPIFSKIVKHVSHDALHTYVTQLEKEIKKYSGSEHPNYGKAAKRMYNVFRITGRFEEAAYVRELFDEPAALLYQIGALLDGLLDLDQNGEGIDQGLLKTEIDGLIHDISSVAEGPSETKLIMDLLKIRDDITGLNDLGDDWSVVILQMQENINELVNEFFEKQLRSIPEISAYLSGLK